MYMDPHFPPGNEGGARPVSKRKRAEREEAQHRARQARLAKLLDQFQRDEIEAAVDGLIAMLDQRDGDADMEDDDRAGELMVSPAVDFDPDKHTVTVDGLPGDPADAEDEGHAEPDGDEKDVAWGEWRSWGDDNGRLYAGQSEDDEPNDDREPEDYVPPQESDPLLRRAHRDRIRRTRCHRVEHPGRSGAYAYPGWTTYRLRDGTVTHGGMVR